VVKIPASKAKASKVALVTEELGGAIHQFKTFPEIEVFGWLVTLDPMRKQLQAQIAEGLSDSELNGR
jgi:hypothetical protein